MTDKQRNFIESLCSQLGYSLQFALDTAKIQRTEQQHTYKDGSTIRRSIFLRQLDNLNVEEASEFIEWLLAEKGGS